MLNYMKKLILEGMVVISSKVMWYTFKNDITFNHIPP